MKLRYRFKRAETESEFEQLFRLNHATFASELEQYPELASGRLVDKFHDRNIYVIALDGDTVVGMISVLEHPPFSVVQRLADPSVLDTYGRLAEIRLLAVKPGYRSGLVMAGLMATAYPYVKTYDTLVISANADQLTLYRGLGFCEIGPPVPSGEAVYIPMVSPLSNMAEYVERWNQRMVTKSDTA